MSKNDLMGALASEIESMNIHPLDRQLEAYMKGHLSAREIEHLYSMVRFDDALKRLLVLYKPVETKVKDDITNEIITRFFSDNEKNDLDNHIPDIDYNSPKKSETKKTSLYQTLARHLKKYYFVLIASPAVAILTSVFLFNLLLTNDYKLIDYNMEIFGSNKQYRGLPNPSEQLVSNEKLLEFYPENQMVIILRPTHSISDPLDVILLIEYEKEMIKLDAEVERSEYGSFKITPKLDNLPHLSGSQSVNLIAIVSKQNTLPSVELILESMTNQEYFIHEDWILLYKPIILNTKN